MNLFRNSCRLGPSPWPPGRPRRGFGGGPDSGATPPAANRASGLISMQITQPFNRFGIAVIQKTALRTVQRGDHSHVLGIEREAEHVEILRDTLRMHRLGNADHTALNQPAQHHLRHRLFVPGGDRQQDFVREQPVLALGERRPRLDLHALRAHELAAAVCWWNGWVST